jgi:hypothetical protein
MNLKTICFQTQNLKRQAVADMVLEKYKRLMENKSLR